MATHKAVVTLGPRKGLKLIDVPTSSPTGNEVKVRVEWAASTPLDIHKADGGLLVNPPEILGSSTAGRVVEIGPDVKNFAVGDPVFGYTWRNVREKAHQEYIVAPENLLGKIPKGFAANEAVTVTNNFVSAFQSIIADLDQELPWPKPDDFVPKDKDEAFLVWGGSSSVGQYTIQILKYYGYKKIIATASTKHHELLKSFGATAVVDYRSPDVVDAIRKAAGGQVRFATDCIGSLEGSIRPLSEIAEAGTIVAIMLPVIIRDAGQEEAPEYAMEVTKVVPWKNGVDARGVRTQFYLSNEFLAKHLQTDIMPAMLADGHIKPNRILVVEGKTLLERAENALDLLRRKVPSAERLVWRVSE